MAQHSTEAARGPIESSVQDRGRAPCAGMRAAVGLKPARLQNADGIRTEPPVSVPMAATAMPSRCAPTVSGCRSEEHTSELQSLMRISYAVFCLKKKNTYNNTT